MNGKNFVGRKSLVVVCAVDVLLVAVVVLWNEYIAELFTLRVLSVVTESTDLANRN